MATQAGTRRRFRPRWSLLGLFVFITVLAAVLARVHCKRCQVVPGWQQEQVVAQRVLAAGGEFACHGDLPDPPRTVLGRWEQAVLEKLIGVKYFLRIKAVNLDRTGTNVKEFQQLGLPELQHLEILHLYGCKNLNDEIGPELIRLTRLRVLTLSHTSVGDETVRRLKQLADLEELRLQGMERVSPEMLEKLKRWPGVAVLWP
jgi:hypothetical protein